MKLKEAEEILQDAYISLLSKELKHPSGTKVRCCKCGNGNTTLRKLPDGQYICNNCYKENNNVQATRLSTHNERK